MRFHANVHLSHSLRTVPRGSFWQWDSPNKMSLRPPFYWRHFTFTYIGNGCSRPLSPDICLHYLPSNLVQLDVIICRYSPFTSSLPMLSHRYITYDGFDCVWSLDGGNYPRISSIRFRRDQIQTSVVRSNRNAGWPTLRIEQPDCRAKFFDVCNRAKYLIICYMTKQGSTLHYSDQLARRNRQPAVEDQKRNQDQPMGDRCVDAGDQSVNLVQVGHPRYDLRALE